MKTLTILKIKSNGKRNKKLTLLVGKNEESREFSGDTLKGVVKFLKERNLKITDLDSIIPLKSNSFTGSREVAVIANIFNGIFKNKPLRELNTVKYHKGPNINRGV